MKIVQCSHEKLKKNHENYDRTKTYTDCQ